MAEFTKEKWEEEVCKNFEGYSIDIILEVLVKLNNFIEVVGCLDKIAIKEEQRVAAFNWEGRTYPAEGGDLAIPAPPWVLGKGPVAITEVVSDPIELIDKLILKKEAPALNPADEEAMNYAGGAGNPLLEDENK